MYKFLLVNLFCLFFCSSEQEPVQIDIPLAYKKNYVVLESNRKKLIQKSQPKDVTVYLPKNYVKNASVDYTDYLQKGINKHSLVLLPNFPVLINKKGLQLKSNSKLIFNQYSKLIMESNGQTNYGILNLINLNNVKVYYANIEGDKYGHLNNKGEWGMGINIIGSKNISIQNAKVSKCWGDGIYMDCFQNTHPTNISIYKAVLNDNRRNGISIISGENIKINYVLAANTKGTKPEAGIDIEPDDNKRILKNINLNNITTYRNGRDGILIALEALVGMSPKNVTISISNHFDDGSPSGLHFYKTTYKLPAKGKLLTGQITVSNSEWINNSKMPVWYDTDKVIMPLKFQLKNAKSGNKSLDKVSQE